MEKELENKLQMLRAKAESSLQNQSLHLHDLSLSDIKTLMHEIQVYQVELEIQNLELFHANESTKLSQKKYLDFYNISPVGFLTLNEDAQIIECNQTLVNMLGFNRVELIMQDFIKFVEWNNRDKFYFYINELDESNNNQLCELKLLTKNQNDIIVKLEGIKHYENPDSFNFRIVVSDITESKNQEFRLMKLVEDLRLANETINEKVYQLNEMKLHLEHTKLKLEDSNLQKDKYIANISDDIVQVFTRFLILTDYLTSDEDFARNPYILELAEDLYSSVKNTIKIIDKYYSIKSHQ